MNHIEARLLKLERRTHILYALIIISMCMGLVTGYAASTSIESLRVKELIVEDSYGNTRVNISVNSSNEVIQHFYDDSGKKRIYLGIQKDGAVKQRFYNENEDVRLVQTVTHDSYKGRSSPYAGINFFVGGEKNDDYRSTVRLVSSTEKGTSKVFSRLDLSSPYTNDDRIRIENNANANILSILSGTSDSGIISNENVSAFVASRNGKDTFAQGSYNSGEILNVQSQTTLQSLETWASRVGTIWSVIDASKSGEKSND